jgi:hypothetical protein
MKRIAIAILLLVASLQAEKTHTTLSSNAPVMEGENVTFCAQTTSQLKWFDENAGTYTFSGTAGQVADQGTYCWIVSNLPQGYSFFDATFSGYGEFAGSTSKIVRQTVLGTAPYAVGWPSMINLWYGEAPTIVSLNNLSTADITVSEVTVSAGFTITKNQCMNGLKAKSHCDVYVEVLESPATGVLTFTDNAVNSPQIVSLY